MNPYKIGQCYPGTYQNDSFHRLVFEEMDGSLAARPAAVEGFGDVRVLVTMEGMPRLFSSRASSGSGCSQLAPRRNCSQRMTAKTLFKTPQVHAAAYTVQETNKITGIEKSEHLELSHDCLWQPHGNTVKAHY